MERVNTVGLRNNIPEKVLQMWWNHLRNNPYLFTQVNEHIAIDNRRIIAKESKELLLPSLYDCTSKVRTATSKTIWWIFIKYYAWLQFRHQISDLKERPLFSISVCWGRTKLMWKLLLPFYALLNNFVAINGKISTKFNVFYIFAPLRLLSGHNLDRMVASKKQVSSMLIGMAFLSLDCIRALPNMCARKVA